VRGVTAAISRGWWAVLGALGLPQSRWQKLPRQRRRAVKAVVWVAVGLVLVAAFGVWENSALLVAVVVLLLVIPSYQRVTFRGRNIGKWIIPGAAVAIVIAYPYYLNSMPQVPVFGPFPMLSTMVAMMIFSVAWLSA
jgi:hypothetical protein